LNAACHGAVLSEFSPTYDHEIYTPTVHEQTAFLVKRGALSAHTELVSITAGANDLGFALVIGVCAFSGQEACDSAVTQATSPLALAGLHDALVQTYAGIAAYAPNSRIAVLGYPTLFDPINPFAPISGENQARIKDATVLVNRTIAAAVQSANSLPGVDAQYIDVTDEFADHGAFSADPWLQLDPNNLTADFNFYPTPEGHRALALALLGAVKPAQLVGQ
jgi:hypothetical protein